MALYGKRIIFDNDTGKILNNTFDEMEGEDGLRPTNISYIDLPIGDTTLQDVDQYHIDLNTKTIVIDSIRQHIPTQDELMQAYLSVQGVI